MAKLPKNLEKLKKKVTQETLSVFANELAQQYITDMQNILDDIVVPNNFHQGAVDLTINPGTQLINIKVREGEAEGYISLSFQHYKKRIGHTMSNKPHDPVDLLWLFNNGWKNDTVIWDPGKAGVKVQTKYKHSMFNDGAVYENSHDTGSYFGDGYILEAVSRFNAMHPEYDTVASANPKYTSNLARARSWL